MRCFVYHTDWQLWCLCIYLLGPCKQYTSGWRLCCVQYWEEIGFEKMTRAHISRSKSFQSQRCCSSFFSCIVRSNDGSNSFTVLMRKQKRNPFCLIFLRAKESAFSMWTDRQFCVLKVLCSWQEHNLMVQCTPRQANIKKKQLGTTGMQMPVS